MRGVFVGKDVRVFLVKKVFVVVAAVTLSVAFIVVFLSFIFTGMTI